MYVLKNYARNSQKHLIAFTTMGKFHLKNHRVHIHAQTGPNIHKILSLSQHPAFTNL